MRLPKSSLVAAACLLAAATSYAYQNIQVLDPTETVTAIDGGGSLSNSTGDPGKINNILFNPAGGGLIQITAGELLTINSEYATTLEAIFQELGTTDTADMVTNANGVVLKVDAGTGQVTGGNLTKIGGGVLQINSATGISAGIRFGGIGPGTFDATNLSYLAGTPLDPTTPLDLAPQITNDPDGRNASRLNGLQGTLTVDQGTVRLVGFVNVWHDFGAGDLLVVPGLPPIPPPISVETASNIDAQQPPFTPTSPYLARRMTGVRQIVLNGSSVIEFTNSPLNMPNRTSTNLAEGAALRVNFLRNIHAGVLDDQFRTEIIAGTTDDYRIILHIDQGEAGSVGILAGAGSFIKTGVGSLTVLNDARFTGDFTAAGGLTILDTAGGLALASAASVNLAGTQDPLDHGSFATESQKGYSRRGQYARYLEARVDVDGDGNDETVYKQAYTPDPGTHALIQDGDGNWVEATPTGASLEIRQDQLIHNFQSNFALRAAPTNVTTVDGVARGSAASAIKNAADNVSRGEPVIAGTGIGSVIELGGHTLTVLQEAGRDGIYEGSILSAVNFAATVTATGGTPSAPTFRVEIDQLPGFGTYRLNLTDASGAAVLTDSIRVDSASDLQVALAGALGLQASAVTVSTVTGGPAALAYDVTLGAAATINAATELASGKLVFTGATDESKLALNLAVGTLAETEITRGSLIANADALGTARINITGGELELFQNQAGTLSASLIGGGTVRAVASALIDNGSGTLIEINSSGNIGTLNFGLQQRQFTGALIVNDGVNVSLSSDTGLVNDTLLNARSITLEGDGIVGSVLSFNNTDQLVRNLSGDEKSSISLGRGTMTLDVTTANTFLGGITGVGSVIKTGSATFNLAGDGRDDYTGATIVREGALTLGSADAVRKTSALILAAGTSVSAGNASQTVGALFGEAGSTVAMGNATLTVGFTPTRYTELGGLILSGAIDLVNLDVWTTLPPSHNYLGTTENLRDFVMPVVDTELGSVFFDRTPLRIDAATELDFTDNIDPATGWPVLGMVDQTRIYLGDIAYRFDRDGDGVVSAGEIAQATASAGTLAFAGVISGAGAAQNVRYGAVNINPLVTLSKTGIETLTLTGTNTFTGAAVVRQGTLELAPGTLAAGVQVYVLANSSTIDLNGDGVTEATALDDGLGNTVLGYDLNRDGIFDDQDRLFDGALAVNVATGTASWSNTILGDGNFVKNGAGTLVLAPAAAQYTGSTTVAAGTLDMTLVETAPGSGLATLGDVRVEDGATLLLRTDDGTTARNFSYIAPNGVVGVGLGDLGNFTKAGIGTLTVNAVDDGFGNLTPRILVGGTVRVQAGVLATDALPNFGAFQTLAIDTGAEFRLTLAADADEWLEAELTGAGTFARLGGGTLLLSQFPDPAPLAAGVGFTGTLSLGGGVTELDLPGSLPNARVALLDNDDLANPTTLRLGAGAFAFAGLTGEAGTVVDLAAAPGGTTLTLTVASGTDSFAGRLTGFGDLVKEGAGALRLAPVDTTGASVDNQINDFVVNAGKLIATIPGLGNANSVTVNAGGTLEFEGSTGWTDRTAPAPAEITYTPDVLGTGNLSKSGTGDILLSGTGNLPTGSISVLGGTLIVDDRRVGSAIPTVTVSSGATFELLLTGDRSLTNQVAGLGGFSLSGGHTLTLLNQPTYSGLTWLRNDADLAFGPGLATPVLRGLAADAADNRVLLAPGSTLTVIQDTEADFAGQFVMSAPGTADLVIQGTAAFRYTADSGNLAGFGGSVTVDGGILQVGGANTKAVTLENDGTLRINVGVADPVTAYTGSVVIANGSSELVKVGGGTLDLTGGLGFVSGLGVFERLVVQEGFARVAVDTNGIIGINKLAVSGTGALEVSVTSGTSTIAAAITSDIANGTGGSITKTGAGTLVLVAGITTDADLVIAGGAVQLGATAASGCVLGGDVTVDALASLTGAGALQGDLSLSGTLAPGYSPGTVTVAGALSFGATSTYAVEVSGSVSDVTFVNGSLAIAPGATLSVTGWDNPATASVVEGGTPGDRHAILVAGGTATIPAQRFTNLRTTAFGTGSPQSLAYLVAYPGDTLGRAGEIDVIVVRATQAGSLLATSLAPAGVAGVDAALVQRLSELARVEVDGAGNVVDLTSGAFGQRLAAVSPNLASGTIRSLTGMSYLAGLGMAHLSAAGDAEEIARRLEQRRFDRGYMSVKPREFFVTATSGKWDAGTEDYAPNYDITRTGALAGYDRDLGTDSVIGWALALDQSKAALVGGGSIESTHARLMGYASTMLADDTAYLQAGVSLGHASMSAVRSEAAFGATSSPSVFTLAAWTRVGTGLLLAPRTSLSPFFQLDVSHAKQGEVNEQGNVDTALSVGSLSQTAVRARAGFSLAQAWDSDRGDWRYRLSLDVAYVASLSGESVTTTATNGGDLGAGGDITATADPLDRGGLVLAPAISFGPDNDTTYSVSTEFRRLGGGDATSINLTYRRRF